MRRQAALLLVLTLATACQPATSSGRPAPSGVTSPTALPGGEDSWPTFQHDAGRSGIGPASPELTGVGQAWSTGLDGAVYASPLVVGDLVVVATENDTVYGLDAGGGQVVWQQHLGEPVRRSQLPCGDIDPTGITGTPVADPATGTVYAVAFVQPGRHDLYALDLASGAVRFHRPVDPPGANPLTHQQRAALTLSRGEVYVSFGGLYGDCGQYRGSVVRVAADGGEDLLAYQVPTSREGGIWSPPGPVVVAGDLLLAVGNAASTAAFDYGNAVLRLSPDLKLVDHWAPSNWAQLSRDDLDVGSITPLPLPGGLVLQGGKAGTAYLLRAGHLGGVGGEVFSGSACTAFGGGLEAGGLAYLPCTDGLLALRVEGSSFSVAWRGAVHNWTNSPILAYGSVWSIDNSGQLAAYDPSTGALRFRKPVGKVAHFATPAAAGGHVYVPAWDHLVAFGAG